MVSTIVSIKLLRPLKLYGYDIPIKTCQNSHIMCNINIFNIYILISYPKCKYINPKIIPLTKCTIDQPAI